MLPGRMNPTRSMIFKNVTMALTASRTALLAGLLAYLSMTFFEEVRNISGKMAQGSCKLSRIWLQISP